MPPCASADEIDAIGTKRYESQSSGEREIQRTMLELLNQLDGFDAVGDVKVRGGNQFLMLVSVFERGYSTEDIHVLLSVCCGEGGRKRV